MNNRPIRLLSLLAALLALGTPPAADETQRPASTEETITFFYYADIDAAERFYRDLLQLEKTMDEGWVRIYRITPSSSVGLVLEGHGLHAVSADKPAMLSIVTDDVDAWFERLTDAGVPVRSELPKAGDEKAPGTAPVRGFVVEDPGGYTIEFFSWHEAP